MEERFFTSDHAVFQQGCDALVDGAVAFLEADFHQSDDLLELVFADAIPHRVAWPQDFGGEHAALAVGARDEPLANDAFQRTGELGDDLRLLVGGKDIDDAVDALVRAAVKGSGLVINIGTGVATSIRDLWTLMAGPDGRQPAPSPRRQHDISRFAIAPTRARIHLAWAPWTELGIGLRGVGR